MKRIIVVACAAVVGAIGAGPVFAAHLQAPFIEIGDVRPVSEPRLAFVEPFVAADPTDPSRLLVTASQIDHDRGIVPRAFISSDGGHTWRSTRLVVPQTPIDSAQLNGLVDIWASFGARGTMYVSMLAVNQAIVTSSRALADEMWGAAPTLLVRSSDHGAHWSTPTVLRARSGDAPKMAVWDDSIIVVTVQLNRGDSVAHAPSDANEYIAFYRSTDAGRTFGPPRFFAFDDLGHNPINPVFLPDGSLILAWMDHPHYGRGGPEQHMSGSRILVMRSVDGGTTFEVPRVVADTRRAGFPAVLRMVTDDGSESPHRGRVYVVWNDGMGTHSDVTLSHSDDGGRHWAEAKHVTATEGGDGADVFTAAGTNIRGVLALMWAHHAKDATTTPCYSMRIAASIDGGESFSAAHDVPGDPICPMSPANKAVTYPFYRRVDTVATSFPHGGDYVGLAATADGVFHAVWTDTRDGPFRVYTARITVRR
jgi:hypothetical protein